MSNITINNKHVIVNVVESKCITSHHITKIDMHSRHHIYPKETLMEENPNNLSYEDIFRIRKSIHHDHIHQTLQQLRVYTREIKYLSFHVEHVAATSTLELLEALAMEALSLSSHIILASC